MTRTVHFTVDPRKLPQPKRKATQPEVELEGELDTYPTSCDRCGHSVTGPRGGTSEGGFIESAVTKENGIALTRYHLWCPTPGLQAEGGSS